LLVVSILAIYSRWVVNVLPFIVIESTTNKNYKPVYCIVDGMNKKTTKNE